MSVFQNLKTIIFSNLPLHMYSRPSLTLKRSTMKTYLLLGAFFCTMLSVNAQNATKSTISFNHVKGLNDIHQQALDSVYYNMSDLNYHFFTLVSKEEKQLYQQAKLLRLIKARALSVMAYYQSNQGVEVQNLFIKYSGQYPTLWLHKPVSQLAASGNIVLDDNERQCFPFNPSTDNVITSKNGNRFFFPPNAFETLNGKTIVNQNIDVCVWEFVDKKSLIYSGLTTDANGKMLETAGSFFIEAKLNGEELKLSQGESYTVEMKSPKSFPDMFTYYGGTKDGLIDWAVNKDEPATFNSALASISEEPQEIIQQIQSEGLEFNNVNYDAWRDNEYGEIDEEYVESAQAVDFYEMSAGKLGWINCDRFYEVEDKTTLAVRIDSDKSMVVRIVFKDINSVMPCYSNSNNKNQYTASGIPKGEKVMLLAYSVKDDNAVLGYKEITIGENDIEDITLNNLTKTRFKSAVSELLSF